MESYSLDDDSNYAKTSAVNTLENKMPTELNIYDANLTALTDIQGLQQMQHLRSINLHRNHIARIECLDTLVNLCILGEILLF